MLIDIESKIETQLKALGLRVELLAGDFRPTNVDCVVLAYGGSYLSEPPAALPYSDAPIIQTEQIAFSALVRTRSLRDKSGLYETVARVRLALSGLRTVPEASAMYETSSTYGGFEGGFWSQTLLYALNVRRQFTLH